MAKAFQVIVWAGNPPLVALHAFRVYTLPLLRPGWW